MKTRYSPVRMVASRYPVDPSLQAPLTVEKYHRMIDAGILGEEDRVELLEGVLVEMSPQSPRHAKIISRFTAAAAPTIGPAYRLRIQLPPTLVPYGEPEPDIAIVTLEEEDAAARHPRTALLVVEVASVSIRKDRLVKTRVYARAGIPEYWIANVESSSVEIYADPDPIAERYRTQLVAQRGETITPSSMPALALSVEALLG